MNKKVVLVSGGSRGLGLAIVKGLLDEGCKVATFSRTVTDSMQELSREHGHDFLFLPGEF